MATSTLIQFLGDGITSPSGTEAGTSNRRQVETFISGGAIAAGDWVSLDVSKTGADKALYVIEAPATASDARCIGVALAAAAAAGEQIRVVVAGYVAVANVVTGTGIGQALTPNGTAGRVGPAEYIATVPALQPSAFRPSAGSPWLLPRPTRPGAWLRSSS